MSTERIVYTDPETGIAAIVVPAPGLTAEDCMRAVPEECQDTCEIVDKDDIPKERTFRNAWKQSGKKLETDLPKAKEIAHTLRRAKRAEMFKPLDIEATVPALAEKAEKSRSAIRYTDSRVQINIESAIDEPELLAVIKSYVEA